jgi:plasmid maintenance system antidote protein VapI
MDEYMDGRPVHPGELLKEEIECRGLSKRLLATQTGMPYKALSYVVGKRRPLTAEMALLMESAL